MPEDVPVWDLFLDQYAEDYISFDYDIHVGKGRPAPNDYPENIKRMAIDLSQRRIDAVGFKEDAIHIIEITRVAGIKAVGQLVTYPLLYQSTFAPTLPLIPVLVTREIMNDIQQIFVQHNIITFLV